MATKKYFSKEERRTVSNIRSAEWRKRHPDYFVKWAEEHRDQRNLSQRERRALDPIKRRVESYARHLMKNYGLTLEDVEAQLLLQGNRCALFETCGSSKPGGRGMWQVDHTHFPKEVWKAMPLDEKRKYVRGLLCHNCNVNRVGNNTIESALAVARYLGWKQ